MNFINSLTTHKIVEPNKLNALRTGNMVAQAPYRQVAAETYLDNGAILFLDTAAELVLGNHANAQLEQPFLHYTEENMNGPVLGTKYFTVDLDELIGATPVCYPRALALEVGDEFTTNNIAGTIPAAGTKKFAILTAGVLTIADAIPTTAYEGPLFVLDRDTLADGTVAAHLTLLKKHLVVTV